MRTSSLLPFVLALSSISCGPQVFIEPRPDGGSGGSSTSSGSSSSGAGAGGQAPCMSDDVSTWNVEYARDEGDYPRAAAATSGVPWVAFAVKNGNIVLKRLGIDDASNIAVLESFEVPNSPVYPLAFDVHESYFALLTTTGNNWNGTLELWWIDRATKAILRKEVGNPENPNYTIRGALGFVDDRLALAYVRPVDNKGVLEIRDQALEIIASESVTSFQLHGVRVSPLEMFIYTGTTTRAYVQPTTISLEEVDWGPEVAGGLESTLVRYDTQFHLFHLDEVWSGPWPHSQISPPAVVRKNNEIAVFSLNTELTGVVGYPRDGALQWMSIEAMPQASGVGVAILPLVEEKRLGLFYLGLEIPQPDQPLRYFGRICR